VSPSMRSIGRRPPAFMHPANAGRGPLKRTAGGPSCRWPAMRLQRAIPERAIVGWFGRSQVKGTWRRLRLSERQQVDMPQRASERAVRQGTRCSRGLVSAGQVPPRSTESDCRTRRLRSSSRRAKRSCPPLHCFPGLVGGDGTRMLGRCPSRRQRVQRTFPTARQPMPCATAPLRISLPVDLICCQLPRSAGRAWR